MVNTELSIEVSSNSNLKVMRLFDTSFYYKDEVVENYMVEVLPVNSDKWVVFHVDKWFNLILNSSNLRYKPVSDVSDLVELPDGIYEIKQSYKPNIHTVNHFYHFRIQNLRTKLSGHMSDLVGEKCSLSREEYRRNREKLRDIEEYLNASKWMIEECHDKKKGLELYEFARKLLEQYTNECQC